MSDLLNIAEPLRPPGRLRVFVAGQEAARRALVSVGQALDGDVGFTVAVIDILEEPALADEAKVLATPLLEFTLVRQMGAVAGVRRFVGGLADPSKLRTAFRQARASLGLEDLVPTPPVGEVESQSNGHAT